jgi:hypothetical protein
MSFDDLGRHRSLDSSGVPSLDDVGRKGEDHCGQRRSGEHGAADERPASGRLDARGVDDHEAPGRETTSYLAVKDREGRLRRALIGGVATDRGAQFVRGDDLVWGEEPRSEGRLAGARGADQDHQARLTHLDRERLGRHRPGRFVK